MQIASVGVERVGDDCQGLGAVEIQDVVMPVRAQDGTMSVEVVLEGRLQVGGLEYCEEFWYEIGSARIRNMGNSCGDARGPKACL